MMELTGLATMLLSSVCMTSPRPCGTTSALAASGKAIVWGNSSLVMTDSAAAKKVVSIYSHTTVPKRRSSLEEPCASALATMTNTSTGAMPFSAPTNRLPNSCTHAAPGNSTASTAPTTRPSAMRRIRLTELYFSATIFATLEIVSINPKPSLLYRGMSADNYICPRTRNILPIIQALRENASAQRGVWAQTACFSALERYKKS